MAHSNVTATHAGDRAPGILPRPIRDIRVIRGLKVPGFAWTTNHSNDTNISLSQRFTARNPKGRTGIVPNHRPVQRQFAPDMPLLRSLRLFAAPTPKVQSRTGNLSAGARTAPCTGVSRISWVRKGSNCFFRLTTPSILKIPDSASG